MQNYKKLQEFDLKEVAEKTQIELKFLKALVEKDFATLNHFNVRGFIKILSREYELDFSDFYEEFENFLSENTHNTETNRKILISQLDSCTKKSSNFFPLFIIIVLLAVIAMIIYYFDTITSFLKDGQNASSSAVITDIIGQAQSNLEDLNHSVIVVDNNQDNAIESVFDDMNSTQEPMTQEYDNESLQNENNESENEALPKNPPSSQDLTQTSTQIAQFKTNTTIWVGLIDLQTYKKTSLVKENDFNVSLKKDQLILTGSAPLSVLNEKGEEKKFPAGYSKRFLIKNGKISSISLAEFMKLNKGKEW